MKIALVDFDFVATGLDYLMLCPYGAGSLTLTTLEQILREGDFNEVQLFPTEVKTGELKSPENLVGNTGEEICQYEPDVLGITANSGTYELALFFAFCVREAIDTKIIMGGTHFREPELWDGAGKPSPIRHPISYTLMLRDEKERKIVDYIGSGQAGFLPNLIHALGSGEQPTEEGVYFMDNWGIWGEEVGSFPRLTQVPVAKVVEFPEESNAIKIITDNLCPNGCGYCSATSPIRYQARAVVDAVTQAFDDNLGGIQLQDSNPFRHGTINHYRQILRGLKEEMARLDLFSPVSVSLDSGLLLDEKVREEIYDIAEEFWIGEYFVGRETPRGVISQALGRRYCGKIRDQEFLDREKKALIEFMRYSGTLNQPPGFIISYIITPEDDEVSLEMLYEDIESLYRVAQESGVVVEFYLFPLVPYPGTEIAEKYAGRYHDDPRFFTIPELFWSEEFTELCNQAHEVRKQATDKKVRDELKLNTHPFSEEERRKISEDVYSLMSYPLENPAFGFHLCQ